MTLSHNLLQVSNDNVLSGLKDLQKRFGNGIVSSSLNLEESHICIQDSFMRERILDSDPQYGRPIGGILTDTTYKFFRQRYLPNHKLCDIAPLAPCFVDIR